MFSTPGAGTVGVDSAVAVLRGEAGTYRAGRAVAGGGDVAANHVARRGLVDLLRDQHAVTKPGEVLKGFQRLDADGFVREVVKRRDKSAARPRPSDLAELRSLHQTEALPIRRREQAVAVAERRLSDLVNAAWGPDAEDMATLRDTAPPRMPPGLEPG